MAATVTEKPTGRRGNNFSAERLYIVTSTDGSTATEAQVLAAIVANVPSTLGGLILAPNDIDFNELVQGKTWSARVPWKTFDIKNQPPNSFHISFDISGTTTHITQAIATVNKYVASGTARDFKGAIGVSQDGTSIDGCDIVTPAMTYTLNYTLDNSTVTNTFIQTLYTVIGKVNSDTFHGFAAGVLLFNHVTGTRREDGQWDLTYGFLCSENATGLTIGDITGIDKKGWEYLWVYYTEQKDTAGSLTYVRKIPTQVNIEQVYKTTAYSALGI